MPAESVPAACSLFQSAPTLTVVSPRSLASDQRKVRAPAEPDLAQLRTRACERIWCLRPGAALARTAPSTRPSSALTLARNASFDLPRSACSRAD